MGLTTSSPIILATAASNGDGDTVEIPDYSKNYKREFRTVFVDSTSWNGATIKLQISRNGTVWNDVPDASFTANGMINIQFNAPHCRQVTSGGGGAEAINMELH